MANNTRQPEIDSLRGLAVLLVMFDHFGINHLYGFPWGIVGVKLLFIFSGYFITRQLLKDTAGGRQLEVGAFYRKRILRIVPVLYVAVFLGILFNLEGARDFWTWHLAFATNYLLMQTGEWPGAFSHFWSLGMQMQFYLVWPLLFLVVPRRFLGWALGVCFVSGFAFRYGMLATHANEFTRWFHLPGSMDAFAVGALVAWIEKDRPEWTDRLRDLRYAALPVAATLLWGAMNLRGIWPLTPWHAAQETLECLFLLWFLLSLRLRVNPFAPLLRLPGLPEVGTVSFGLYAFHPLVENSCARWLFPHMGSLVQAPGMRETLLVILSLGAAAICYKLVETKSVAIVDWISARVNALAGSFRGIRVPYFNGVASAAMAIAIVAGPIIGFHRQPQSYEQIAATVSPAPPVETLQFVQQVPEFDWGYLPFEGLYDQAPARDVEVSNLDEIEVPAAPEEA